MGVTHLLSNDGYIILNKRLVIELGLDEALIIGELAAEYNYWEQSGELTDGYFYSTIENISKNIGMSDYRQRECLKRLEKAGFINIKVKGVPPKRFIKINEDAILKFFNIQYSKNLKIKSQKISELNAEKFERNNNKKNNKNIKDNTLNRSYDLEKAKERALKKPEYRKKTG